MKLLWILVLWSSLTSDLALSQPVPPDYPKMIELAEKAHKPTERLNRLRKAVFTELGLTDTMPLYFADMANIAAKINKPRAIGVCFHLEQKMVVDTAVQRYSDTRAKLVIMHEVIHCYASYHGHDPRTIQTPVGRCSYSLMYPAMGSEKCSKYMYPHWLQEARNLLEMLGLRK